MHEEDESPLPGSFTRPSSDVTIKMPDDVIEHLREVAESKDMSFESLIRFYVGQSLRRDSPRRYNVIPQAESESIQNPSSPSVLDEPKVLAGLLV